MLYILFNLIHGLQPLHACKVFPSRPGAAYLYFLSTLYSSKILISLLRVNNVQKYRNNGEGVAAIEARIKNGMKTMQTKHWKINS